MRVSIDTREPWPHPWATHFSPDVILERATLDVGDLVASALVDGVCVERKATGDLLACIGRERERFDREIRRGRYVGQLLIVCEGSMADLFCEARRRGGGVSDNAIVGSLAAWQRRGTPVFMAGSIALAAQFCERVLRGQITEAQRTAKSIARVEAGAP